jgi:hypothetical protein
MTLAQNVLIVEGETDRDLFQALLGQRLEFPKSLKLQLPTQTTIAVRPIFKNVKTEAIRALHQEIAREIEEAETRPGRRLGLIVDADHIEHDWGFEKTRQTIDKKLASLNYHDCEALPESRGFIAHSKQGLMPIGLWIMPNNQDAGDLERFILDLIPDHALLQQAERSVDSHALRPPAPKIFKKDKAHLYTWLAWQEAPSQWLKDVTAHLDKNHRLYQDFLGWLRIVFPDCFPHDSH